MLRWRGEEEEEEEEEKKREKLISYGISSVLRLNLLVQRLEERDKHSELTIAASEKEVTLKQQALDLHKKRVNH